METKFEKSIQWLKKIETIELVVNETDFEYERKIKPNIKISFHIYPYEDLFFYYKETKKWENVSHINSLHNIWKQTIEEIKKHIYSIKYLYNEA
jgi:hypothetical protein